MDEFKPNSIEEYYIAYFDILGYKEFFKEKSDNEQILLEAIHDAISKTKNLVNAYNSSALVFNTIKSTIKIKVFSDNILLCEEISKDKSNEKIILITFLLIVSEIQRNFILRYGLFVRGGVSKGKLSFNENYIFGEGLIEVVEIEETTKYPRIAISNKITDILTGIKLYSRAEADRAIKIEEDKKCNITISEEDNEFLNKMCSYAQQEYISHIIFNNMCYLYNDGVVCLSYLYCFDIRSFIPEANLVQLLELAKTIVPEDYQKFKPQELDLDSILNEHKKIIEQKLIKYSNYSAIDIGDTAKFDMQERILKKYVWAMGYHNYICDIFYNKPQFRINSTANCEKPYIKLSIHIVDENNNII